MLTEDSHDSRRAARPQRLRNAGQTRPHQHEHAQAYRVRCAAALQLGRCMSHAACWRLHVIYS